MIKLKIFYSHGCPYCPDALELARRISHLLDIQLEEVDVTNNISTLVEEKIMGVPTVILYSDGKEVKRYVGLGKIISDLAKDIVRMEDER